MIHNSILQMQLKDTMQSAKVPCSLFFCTDVKELNEVGKFLRWS